MISGNQNKAEPFWLFQVPEIVKNLSVSRVSMTQKGPALFQEPESFKKVQFKAQENLNF